jgi:predicted ATPase
MSPEQCDGGRLVDHRSDIYALGVVLYQMLCAQPPFVTDSVTEMVSLHLLSPPPPLRIYAPAVSPALAAVVMRMLEKSPARRFASMGELAAALEDAAPAGARAPTPAPARAAASARATPTLVGLPSAARSARDGAAPAAPRSNLHAETSSFIGRTAELDAIAAAFAGGARVVTLLGPGGMGKTRVANRHGAMAVAARAHPGGVWFCDLAAARSTVEALARVAAALDVPLEKGGDEDAGATQIGHALAARAASLVLLDNCEQVVGPARALVSAWRALAPETRFLATSRQALELDEERVLVLEPLAAAEGSALFVERARAARPAFQLARGDEAVVDEIVRRLDGIPLALELAAGRAPILSPEALLARIGQRFQLLGGDRPDAERRQATMRATIEWSWDLLAPHERDTLAQCAVFAGGLDLEAAEAVIDLSAHAGAPWLADVLHSLLAKSVLHAIEAAPGEAPRFGLYESIHAFAGVQLEGAPATLAAAQARHAAYYLARAEAWAAAATGADAAAALAGLAREQDNMLAAMHRTAASDPATAARLGLALDALLVTAAATAHHLGALDATVAAADAASDPLLAIRARLARAEARRLHARRAGALEDCEVALALAKSARARRAEGEALAKIATLEREHGDAAAARSSFERALAIHREQGDAAGEAGTLGNLATALVDAERSDEARELLVQALRIAGALENRALEGKLVGNLGVLTLDSGDVAEARLLHERALAIHRARGDRRSEAIWINNLGNVWMETGDADEAARSYAQAAELHAALGNRTFGAVSLARLSHAALHRDCTAEAREVAERALALVRPLGNPKVEGMVLSHLAAALTARGQLRGAAKAFAESQRLLEGASNPGGRATRAILEGLLDVARAKVSAAAGDPTGARAQLAAASARLQGDFERFYEARWAARLLRRLLATAAT